MAMTRGIVLLCLCLYPITSNGGAVQDPSDVSTLPKDDVSTLQETELAQTDASDSTEDEQQVQMDEEEGQEGQEGEEEEEEGEEEGQQDDEGEEEEKEDGAEEHDDDGEEDADDKDDESEHSEEENDEEDVEGSEDEELDEEFEANKSEEGEEEDDEKVEHIWRKRLSIDGLAKQLADKNNCGKSGKFTFKKSVFDDDFKVTLYSNRRRSAKCFHPSIESGSSKPNVIGPAGTCACYSKLLASSKNTDALQAAVCASPGVCAAFKAKLNCHAKKASLTEAMEQRANQDGSQDSASVSSMDSSLEDKCTR